MNIIYRQRLAASELANRPPWLWVTSRELARALSVHPQTLNNWRHRERGPAAAPSNWFRGNTARYRIDTVLAWADEEAGLYKPLPSYSGEWLRDNLGFEQWQERDAVWARVKVLMGLGSEFRPRDLTKAGKEGLDLLA